MNDHAELRLALGSYLVGALSPAERSVLETHLRECIACRDELNELSVLPGFLGRLTPEQVQGGFPPPPESLLTGLLARALGVETARRRRLRRRQGAAAALSLAAAAIVGILVIPTASTPGTSYQLQSALASTPSAGEVTLVTKPWGTELILAMRKLPAGTSCVAVVTDKQGRIEVVGTWGATTTHAAQVTLATDISTAYLRTITVETAAGKPLLNARLVV